MKLTQGGEPVATAHNFDESHSFASQAIALMAKYNITAAPKNFEVWYSYATGCNQELKEKIDRAIADNRLSDRLCLQLHQTELNPTEKMSDSVKDVGDRMEVEMDEVISRLNEAMQQTSAYGDTLQLASGQLDKESTGANVKVMIDNLVTATRHMEQRSKQLENRLEQTASKVRTLQNNLEEIRIEASTDQLTKLPNRKAFDEKLDFETKNAARTGNPLTLLFTDIDYFKKFNDTWGHQTGDTVLRLVSLCLDQNVTDPQMAARFGGEEFAVILPNTSLEDSKGIAENIREVVAKKKLQRKSTGEDLGHITISIGVAQFNPGEPIADFVHRADACLYAAKRAGRNRVIAENDPNVDLSKSLEQGAA